MFILPSSLFIVQYKPIILIASKVGIMSNANMTISDEYTDYFNHFIVNRYATFGCASILTILLCLDVYKAFQRRAHWIPAEALVLTALIIQLLTFVDNYLNLNANSSNEFIKDSKLIILIQRPLVFDSRRVMICIFIAYLLPGVAHSGLRTVWGDIGAVALPVMWHMSYELYYFLEGMKEQKSLSNEYLDAYNYWQLHPTHRVWFTVSYISFFTTLTLLIVLLTCAVIAGKTISKIMSEKISLALSCCCNCSEKQDCKDIEIHVLKCFIVTRASQPDYIIARSVLSAFAGMVTTFCIGLLVAKWMWKSLIRNHHTNRVFFYFQFGFILIGWIVVLFRWFTAVLYFPKDVRCLFNFEDFWTRTIVDMKNDLDAHLTTGFFREKKNLERTPVESIVVNLITTFKLHRLLLIMGLWLQNLMVLVSKVCWCLSEPAFRMVRPFIMSRKHCALLCGLNLPEPETDQFNQYKEALEVVRMPGEIAYSLWIANLSAFKKVENNIHKGFENSKGTCDELITLMEYKTGTVEDETPTILEDKKHFKEVGQKSCKMRAVSTIHFMMYFYDGSNHNVVNDSIKAYRQARCFMDLVDSLDPEGYLESLAADKEFDTIENIWKTQLSNMSNQLLEEKIKRPLKERMDQLNSEEQTPRKKDQKAPCVDKVHDSKDWMTVAANISLYKTWEAMDLKSNSVNAIHVLRCLLADLIVHCMGPELDKAVIENCSKWAKDGKEKEIINAAFVVGQAKAVGKPKPMPDQV